MVILKSPEEIRTMRQGGKILAQILKRVSRATKPGARAGDLNDLAEALIRKNKTQASFKDYQGFPASLCVSINNEVVHGVPNGKVIKAGNVVGLDLGIKHKNLYTDAALTVVAGRGSEKLKNFVLTCKQALNRGIAQVKPGNHIGDISWAIQCLVERRGYSVVRELVGHGVGHKVHEEPRIPNYGRKGEGIVLKVGMTLCLEPMINMGGAKITLAPDGHTFQTADQSLAAHFEHTVAVTKKGCLVLTE